MPKADCIPARTPIVNLPKPNVTSLGDAGTGDLPSAVPLHRFPTNAKAGLEVTLDGPDGHAV